MSMYAVDHQTYTSGFTLQNLQKQLQETGDQITTYVSGTSTSKIYCNLRNTRP